MSLEVTGKLVAKLNQQTGQGRNGAWVKQEFILETMEQYPKKICLSAWGDKIRDFESLNIGEQVKVSINIESREFNGRWYTDLRPWRVERVAQGATSSSAPEPPPMPSDFPPPPMIEPEQATDDLPF